MRTSPFLVLALGLMAASSCVCRPVINPVDAGTDGGSEGEGEGEGSEGEGEGGPDAGPACTESTPGFGDACGDCGTQVCNPIQDALACNDPGFNNCGACGDLDESAGRVGQPCGVELCGVGACNIDNTATECLGGETPRNACGGCNVLQPAGAAPGDVCSTCASGIQTCTSDQEDLECFRGRDPSNQCGGCERCVLFHALMEDHVPGGGYLGPGTTAIIESVGAGQIQLVFDPLVEGPGACCLPTGTLFLSSAPNPFDGTFVILQPVFSSTLQNTLSDPVRAYPIPLNWDSASQRFLILADDSNPRLFQDPVFSIGELVGGPPP